MKRFALATLFGSLLLTTSLFGQNDLTKSEITTNLSNDATLSAALPRSLTVSNVSCANFPNAVTFRLYSNESDISAVWQETQVVVSHPGSYNHIALVGATTNGVPAEVFSSENAHWLGIQCTGEAEMARTILTATSYSVHSADSDSLGGKPASAYALADSVSSVNTTALNANLNSESSRAQMAEGNLSQEIAAEVAARKDAISSMTTTNQTTMLRTDQPNSYTSSNSNGYSVKATVTTFGNSGFEGLHAETDHPYGMALVGIGKSTSLSATGVYGLTYGEYGGSGVWGSTNAAHGSNSAGVYGDTNGPGVGGWFEAYPEQGSATALFARSYTSETVPAVFANAGTGKIMSLQTGLNETSVTNATEVLSVMTSGDLTTIGKVTAASFAGDGSLLTGVASQSSINAEIARAQGIETSLTASLNAEINNRQAAVATMTSNIGAEITNRQTAVAAVSTALNSEVTTRVAAEVSLQASINAVAASEVTLQASINAVAASVPKQVFGNLTVSGASQSANFPAGSFTSAPICVVAPTSLPPTGTPYAVTSTSTTITVTISGTHTIAFNYFCSGN
ncbi:MAG: hypothetical protein JWO13_2408 [Acidobacteriales bacterium]|nr:hypothetical protein [Terriglobales bacterium]